MTKKRNWWRYTAYVDTGFVGAEYTEEIDLRQYDFSQEQWEKMSYEEKNNFFKENNFAEELLRDQIESGVRHEEDKDEQYC